VILKIPKTLLLTFIFCHLTGSLQAGGSTFYQGRPAQFGTITIRSSSTLPNQGGNSYGPKNLADSDRSNAWVEGAKGDGIGEWVEIRFNQLQAFSTIVVVNGCAKSQKLFFENNRIRTALISTEDLKDVEIPLADTMEEQRLILPKKVNSSWVRLTIKDVYKGTKFSDTCLSEFYMDLDEHNYDPPL
jgi:hypothetical protein